MSHETRINYRLTYEHVWVNPQGDTQWCNTQKDSPSAEIHLSRLRNAKYKQSIGAARNLRVQVIQETILHDEEVGNVTN